VININSVLTTGCISKFYHNIAISERRNKIVFVYFVVDTSNSTHKIKIHKASHQIVQVLINL